MSYLATGATITRAALNNLAVVTKSANYTALATDDVILGTGTWTLTLPPANGNQDGAGFQRPLYVSNNGSGIITIARAGADTFVNGATSILLYGSQSVAIVPDGTSKWVPVATGIPRLSYTPTLANVLNTAVKTSIVSATIPANDLSDGSVLTMRVASLAKNNKGSSGTVTFGMSYAGIADQNPTEGFVTWNNVVTEFPVIWEFQMMRVGADLWMNMIPFNNVQSVSQLVQTPYSFYAAALDQGAGGGYSGGNARKIVAPTFTADQTLALNVTLSAADANFYIKPQSAQIRRVSL